MIAVYVNEAGNTASPGEKGLVSIYKKEECEWKVYQEVPFCIDSVLNLAEVRKAMIEMVHQLGGCKVFAAKEVVGQLYYVLEANGFDTFEAEGKPELFLDSIWEAVQTNQSDKNENAKTIEPITYFEKSKEEGFYFINLRKVLNRDCSLSSKKLLIPFLQKKDYVSLEMICDHLPRWLDTELEAMELSFEVIKLKENELKVSITRK